MSPSHSSGSFDSRLRTSDDETDGLADAGAVGLEGFCEIDFGALGVAQSVGFDSNISFGERTVVVALFSELAVTSLAASATLVCCTVGFCSAITVSAETILAHSDPELQGKQNSLFHVALLWGESSRHIRQKCKKLSVKRTDGEF